MSVKLCECGCRQPAPISTRGDRGYAIGQPMRFINGHSIRGWNKGKTHPPTNVSHGASRTPEYGAYRAAKYRCERPENKTFDDYGGRGIQFNFLCFEQFFAELGPKPSPEHSLDRINNDGHYEPGNVRWATKDEQLLNRRPYRKAA
jgi:hypothetical protein